MERLDYILEKYLNGSCNEQEFHELWQILSENPDLINQDLHNRLQNTFVQTTPLTNNALIEGIVKRNRICLEKVVPIPRQKSKTYLLYNFKLVGAAAICLIFSFIYYLSVHKVQHEESLNETGSILQYIPATQQATLTLNDGRFIRLDSGTTSQISLQGDALLINGEETLQGSVLNKEVTISTPRGAYFIVTLPDGSKVHLHAASKISFSSSFQSARAVQLWGEAYFDVTHDPSRKFTVKTEKQSVEVLGTRFNIGAYSNEPTQTTLVEGSVKVLTPNHKSIILKPGEQAVNRNENLTIRNVDSEDYTSWTQGELRFVKEPINILLEKISRWYNIDVQIDENVPTSVTFSGQLFKETPLKDFLYSLQESSKISFELKENKLIVKTKT
ncbi:FecR family protein [Sphingobacterium yanglingense]|uniref:FecR family protein n=1 Tax=Sphingobacterium yanglingense TaxID=1437280 RepID=A0A4R6WC44_9SPHI|nr:FecR family protein [Sphingobacterium yanglingense]TDQ75324.1 FecR family protein [Sphingobacterium yanglingense]